MKTCVVLPTYQRPEKLARLIRSMDGTIPPGTEIHVGWSPGDPTRPASDRLLPTRPWLRYFTYAPEFHAAEFWNTFFARVPADVYIYLSDDCELQSDTLTAARLIYLARFPRYDGLLGFDQVNLRTAGIGTCPAAFGAVGREFVNTFPNRRVCCPDYYALWVDQELLDYALAVGRFAPAPEVRLLHHHPAADPAELDETHAHIRRFKRVDDAVRAARRNRRLVWGLNWDLLRPAVERGLPH